MAQIIEAVYEDGVIKPLKKLNLRDKEKIRIKIMEKSIVDETFGILPVDSEKMRKIIEEVEDEWGVY